MSTNEQVVEILHALKTLPLDKITEAHDFVLYLKHRYGKENDTDRVADWTEEDMQALALAVWKYGEETVPWEEKNQRFLDL